MKTESFFSLEKLIVDTIIDYKKRALEKDIELILSDDLASYITLKGNSKKLYQLLDSLLNNAIENTNATEIAFSVRQLLRTDKDILLEFLIEDNGTANKHTRNFRYHRTLATANEMVASLNGKSELIKHPDYSSTYKFIIKAEWQNSEPEQAISIEYNGSLKGKRILLAEDNEINQKVIIQMLRREGLMVDLAADGKMATEMFENNYNYDLILMDVQMPNMDGLHASRYIRRKISGSIPIIAISASANSLEQSQCYQCGINQYMSKPFTQAELIEQLRHFLVQAEEPVKKLADRIKKIAV